MFYTLNSTQTSFHIVTTKKIGKHKSSTKERKTIYSSPQSLITIGLTGLSIGPVGLLSIFINTSAPSVTSPNTCTLKNKRKYHFFLIFFYSLPNKNNINWSLFLKKISHQNQNYYEQLLTVCFPSNQLQATVVMKN